MTEGKLTILNVGDIHFAHPETPTEHIIQNLDLAFTDELLDTIDLMTIAGDVFHQLIPYNDPSVGMIEAWITRLLMRCAYRNVILRVVEGTPYHDRKQPAFFVRQAAMTGIPVNVKYFDKLDIEYIPELGVHILYVPDKWRDDTQQTLDEVKVLMADRHIEQVDIALMHGAFAYQLPHIVEEPTHDEEEYLKLVRGPIFIGHVHVSMPKGRIIPSGSFDRLTHGEEAPKGFHVVTFDLKTGDFTSVFHENRWAKIYKTIELHDVTEEQLWATVKEIVDKYPKGSSIAFKINRTDVIAKCIKDIEKECPDYQWKFSLEKTKKDKSKDMREALNSGAIHLPPLTENILADRLTAVMRRQGVSEEDITLALALMERDDND